MKVGSLVKYGTHDNFPYNNGYAVAVVTKIEKYEDHFGFAYQARVKDEDDPRRFETVEIDFVTMDILQDRTHFRCLIKQGFGAPITSLTELTEPEAMLLVLRG